MGKYNDKHCIRLGVIGTGRIANRFVQESVYVKHIRVEGIYNPRLDSAERFAGIHGINFYTDSEEALYEKIEAVYIASPHDTHYDYIINALMHNKHVLIEKPMVLKKSQAEEAFFLAKDRECVLMEGIKTAYCPGFISLIDVAKSGKIGDIKDVEACFTKLTNSELRELSDIEAGGSFTELGSYTLMAIIKLLGLEYQDIRFDSFFNEGRVDLYTKAYFNYTNSLATSKTGLGVKSEGQLLISGTKGYIRVDAPWWKTTNYEVCYEDSSLNERFTNEFLGDGLRYEISDFVSAINCGYLYESKLEEQESIAIVEVIEKFLLGRTARV